MGPDGSVCIMLFGILGSLKECSTVLMLTAFLMEVNQVCVEPED